MYLFINQRLARCGLGGVISRNTSILPNPRKLKIIIQEKRQEHTYQSWNLAQSHQIEHGHSHRNNRD
jgi:hypothetical protein